MYSFGGVWHESGRNWVDLGVNLAYIMLGLRYSCIGSSLCSLTALVLLNLQLCCYPSVLWHCWVGDRNGIRPVKSWMLVCWWWRFDWSFARLIAPVVTTTSIILSFSKIQNEDIWVSANPGPTGKWPLKWRERFEDTRFFQSASWAARLHWWGLYHDSLWPACSVLL